MQALPVDDGAGLSASRGCSFSACRRMPSGASSPWTAPALPAAPSASFLRQADQELTIDFFRAGMATFTDPGDRALIPPPGETPGSVGDLLAIALERMGVQPIQHGLVCAVGETLQVMRR